MINAIAAIGGKKRVIANKGQIPWYIPEDFAYFKKITIGHPIIMGRKTFETFKKPLIGRTHIVITRDTKYVVPKDILVTDSIEKAIEIAKNQPGSEEIFIIGGGQIYEMAFPYTQRLYITLINNEFEGDTFFPDYDEFKKVISEQSESNENFKYKFLILER